MYHKIKMQVCKRDGSYEDVSFDKISHRIQALSKDLKVEPLEVSKMVCSRIIDKISTTQLDTFAAEIAATNIPTHPDYGTLAARLAISNLHKNTVDTFSEYISLMKEKAGCIKLESSLIDMVENNKERLDAVINTQADFNYDYFGFTTLCKMYLFKIGDAIVERPQYMLMRVSLCLSKGDIDEAILTYQSMSNKKYIHATPTLFHAGTNHPQLASCFTVSCEDSIESIFNMNTKCALISKGAGGIGASLARVRRRGGLIKSVGGSAGGLVPLLRQLNDTARYVNQSGRRKGSIAVYIEPWHADIFDFLEAKNNFGDEEMRARDLFYALWIPDLFMERVKSNGYWSLMCPDECQGLVEAYGDEFRQLYTKYEKEGRYYKQIKAQDVWKSITKSQIETGTPYMLYKDAANIKSNQKNLGTIISSNLCTEIIQYHDPNEYSVCNLASISLPNFIKDGVFDFDELQTITGIVVRNIDRSIDINLYPVEEAERSNTKNRPMGIGIQGLADTFAIMGLPFTSDGAKQLNIQIFSTIYYAAVKESIQLAEKYGTYPSYEGSPASQGQLQYDLWGVKPCTDIISQTQWDELKENLAKHGLRNSLLMAPMPTASTSQMLGNNECIEPFTSMVYKRTTLAGEFVLVNKYLVRDLDKLGLWDKTMFDTIVMREGSIQALSVIPEEIRDKYQTAWDMSQKHVVDMSADRAPYICQSQSMNIFLARPTNANLSAMHFYAWSKGLKTGSYYIRGKPATRAQVVGGAASEGPQCLNCSA
jgi:ribonucleoside-diphosphate reductase alpha chain